MPCAADRAVGGGPTGGRAPPTRAAAHYSTPAADGGGAAARRLRARGGPGDRGDAGWADGAGGTRAHVGRHSAARVLARGRRRGGQPGGVRRVRRVPRTRGDPRAAPAPALAGAAAARVPVGTRAAAGLPGDPSGAQTAEGRGSVGVPRGLPPRACDELVGRRARGARGGHSGPPRRGIHQRPHAAVGVPRPYGGALCSAAEAGRGRAARGGGGVPAEGMVEGGDGGAHGRLPGGGVSAAGGGGRARGGRRSRRTPTGSSASST